MVFTGKDSLDHENRDFGEFLQTSIHPMIEDVLRKCNNHCVPFNNMADAQENSAQVKTLLGVVDEVVAQNGGSFFSTETFNSTKQQLRRKVASSVLAISEKFHFNLGVLYIMISLLMLLCFVSSVIIIARLLPKPPLTTTIEPDSYANFTPPPSPDIRPIRSYPCTKILLSSVGQGICLRYGSKRCDAYWFDPAIPTPDLRSMRSYPYTQVLLSSVRQGICLNSKNNRRCIVHWFDPVIPTPDLPPIRSYPCIQILLSSVRQGICLRFKTKRRCVAHWFDPAIPTPDLPPIRSYPCIQILLSSVRQGICLRFKSKRRCALHWFDPAISTPDLPPIRSYPYIQVLLSSVGQGVCLVFEKNRCVPHWFRPKPIKYPSIQSYPYSQVLLSSMGRGVCLVFERYRCVAPWYDPVFLHTAGFLSFVLTPFSAFYSMLSHFVKSVWLDFSHILRIS